LAKVLVIGDTHAPAMHRDYIKFLNKVRKKWKTTQVVHIGDVLDHHCCSFHDKHPENPGASMESKLAQKQIDKLYSEFPKATVCIGNHDARIHRLNASVGIPSLYLKEFNGLYATHGWDWVNSTTIDGVYYYHGEGAGGRHPSFSAAKMRMESVVCGHYHSSAGIWWQAGPTTKVFGMNVGCGVDRSHWAMAYGGAFLKKPILSCGVVIDGSPYLEVMEL
jgi:predicted phosphodiesterase